MTYLVIAALAGALGVFTLDRALRHMQRRDVTGLVLTLAETGTLHRHLTTPDWAVRPHPDAQISPLTARASAHAETLRGRGLLRYFPADPGDPLSQAELTPRGRALLRAERQPSPQQRAAHREAIVAAASR